MRLTTGLTFLMAAPPVKIINTVASSLPETVVAFVALAGLLSTTYFAWRSSNTTTNTLKTAELRRDQERRDDWERERRARFLETRRDAYLEIFTRGRTVERLGNELASQARANDRRGVRFATGAAEFQKMIKSTHEAIESFEGSSDIVALLAPSAVVSVTAFLKTSRVLLAAVTLDVAIATGPNSATTWTEIGTKCEKFVQAFSGQRSKFTEEARRDLAIETPPQPR